MTPVAILDYLILIVHVIVCVLLIGIVLIQGGKGASMSASLGMGAASTAFGARTDTFMTKLTSGAAITFVVTSLALTFLSSKTGSLSQQITAEPVPSAAAGAQQSATTTAPETAIAPAGTSEAASSASETAAEN